MRSILSGGGNDERCKSSLRSIHSHLLEHGIGEIEPLEIKGGVVSETSVASSWVTVGWGMSRSQPCWDPSRHCCFGGLITAGHNRWCALQLLGRQESVLCFMVPVERKVLVPSSYPRKMKDTITYRVRVSNRRVYRT
jgi:hypothetical protein